MRRMSAFSLRAVSAAISVCVGGAAAFADPATRALDHAPPFAQSGAGPQVITSVASGVVELIRQSEASLHSDCAEIGPFAGSIVVQLRITYTALEGACGLPGLPACDGRITEIAESCAGPDSTISETPIGGPEVTARYTMRTVKVRRCFDPLGLSDCTGAAPAAQIISEGEQSSFGLRRPDAANPNRLFTSITSELPGYEITEIDGRNVSVPDRTAFQQTYGEGLDGSVCGFRGIAEAVGGGQFETRACEFVTYTTGAQSH